MKRTRKPRHAAPVDSCGAQLRQWRVDANLTQKEAAERIGLGTRQSWIAELESNNVSDPDPDLLRALADTYKVPHAELLWHFIKQKYRLDTKSFVYYATGLGDVYASPEPIVDSIISQKKELLHAWFFLAKSDAHREPPEDSGSSANPYYRAMRELIQAEVQLRVWIRDKDARKVVREKMYQRLQEDGLSLSAVQQHLDYPADERVLERIFGTVGNSIMAQIVNEVYFLKAKPSEVQPEDLLVYWTIPAQSEGKFLDGLVIKITDKQLAFERFQMLRTYVTGH